MDPVDRRAPHNELPLEQLDYASDSNARAQAAHARRTPGASAPLRAAGSFGQEVIAECKVVCSFGRLIADPQTKAA